jgi:GTP 3',8-cyclase
LLRDAGLRRITVSLDSLDEAVFQRMNGVDFPAKLVLDGIAVAQRVGLSPVKVNMVVKRGVNDAQILPVARHFRGTGVVVRFIEFMDVGTTNGWNMESVVPSSEVVAAINETFPLTSVGRDKSSDTSQRYRYTDGQGEIGVISSVTQPFCGGCTRMRLSANGQLFTCLFASHGLDIRASLRSGASDDARHERRRDTSRNVVYRRLNARGRASGLTAVGHAPPVVNKRARICAHN